MRILQVVALVSGTNAYGGPTTVALNQCRALADAGHDVILAATGATLRPSAGSPKRSGPLC